MKLPFRETEVSNEAMTDQVPANVEVMLIERERAPTTANMEKCNPKLTEPEVTRLINLMNEYRRCYAFNIFELGCANTLTMNKVITTGSKQTIQSQYCGAGHH